MLVIRFLVRNKWLLFRDIIRAAYEKVTLQWCCFLCVHFINRMILNVSDRAVRFFIWTKMDLETVTAAMELWKDLCLFVFPMAFNSLISSAGATWGSKKWQVSVMTIIYITLTGIVYKLLKGKHLNIYDGKKL